MKLCDKLTNEPTLGLIVECVSLLSSIRIAKTHMPTYIIQSKETYKILDAMPVDVLLSVAIYNSWHGLYWLLSELKKLKQCLF